MEFILRRDSTTFFPILVILVTNAACIGVPYNKCKYEDNFCLGLGGYGTNCTEDGSCKVFVLRSIISSTESTFAVSLKYDVYLTGVSLNGEREWAAVGISPDDKMGYDVTLDCVSQNRTNPTPLSSVGMNLDKRDHTHLKPDPILHVRYGIRLTEPEQKGSILHCQFTHDWYSEVATQRMTKHPKDLYEGAINVVKMNWLQKKYHLLLAHGQLKYFKERNLYWFRAHGAKNRIASEEPSGLDILYNNCTQSIAIGYKNCFGVVTNTTSNGKGNFDYGCIEDKDCDILVSVFTRGNVTAYELMANVMKLPGKVDDEYYISIGVNTSLEEQIKVLCIYTFPQPKSDTREIEEYFYTYRVEERLERNLKSRNGTLHTDGWYQCDKRTQTIYAKDLLINVFVEYGTFEGGNSTLARKLRWETRRPLFPPTFEDNRIAEDCEQEDTGCFGFFDSQADCIKDRNCRVRVTVVPHESHYNFTLTGFIGNSNWIAFGISEDEVMGNDVVFQCIEYQKVFGRISWNTHEKTNLIATHWSGVEIIRQERQGNWLSCKYVVSLIMKIEFGKLQTILAMLENRKYHIILAYGDVLLTPPDNGRRHLKLSKHRESYIAKNTFDMKIEEQIDFVKEEKTAKGGVNVALILVVTSCIVGFIIIVVFVVALSTRKFKSKNLMKSDEQLPEDSLQNKNRSSKGKKDECPKLAWEGGKRQESTTSIPRILFSKRASSQVGVTPVPKTRGEETKNKLIIKSSTSETISLFRKYPT